MSNINNTINTDILLQLRDIFTQCSPEDKIRLATEFMYNLLIQTDAEAKIGAAKYERTPDRSTSRNGFREKTITSNAGELTLEIPKFRSGSYFPSFLIDRRTRIDSAMAAVVMEAYTKGVSTRKVDSLVKAMGADVGISKSEVSRICKELDTAVAIFENRPLTRKYPYLYLDATYLKARNDGSVQSTAVVIAIGIDERGYKEIIGFDIGNTESEEFWSEFIAKLNNRCLKGVKLVITDSHSGLKAAINKKLIGSTWQRCKVHFMRNILAKIPKKKSPLIIPLVKTIFTAESKEEAYKNFDKVVEAMNQYCPEVTEMLLDAKEDILAYLSFPQAHWGKISSSNLLERFNKEIKRRSNVIQIFPDRMSVRRLIGTMIIEQNDEWLADDRRYLTFESMYELYNDPVEIKSIEKKGE
jgi:transposase-like protein